MAEIQAEWLAAREQEPAVVEVQAAPAIEVRDYRTASNPEAVLRGLIAEGNVQIWAEGVGATLRGRPGDLTGIETRTRQPLTPGPRLAVWTLPPGPRELQAALAQVQPHEVILFAQDPGLDDASAFLHRLAGMAKFALHATEGQVDLAAAAAAAAHRLSTVQAGLEWLAAQGQVTIVERGDDRWRLATGTGHPDPQAVEAARQRLDTLLAETAAYRAYIRNAPATTLIRG